MRKFLVSLFLLLFISSILFVESAFAQNIQSSNDITVSKDQTIEGDFFASGDNITISGTINGDAYIAGGNVLIEGTINGDIIAAGGNVNISGNAANNIRVAGGQIIISGPVGKNVTVVGGNATLSNSARVEGSLVSAAGMINIQAPINRGINIAAGNAILASSINGDINAGVGNLTITPNANISGDINYWSNQQANIQQGATVSGQVKQNTPQQPNIDETQTTAILSGLKLMVSLGLLLSYLLGGLLLITFFPNYTNNISQTISEKPLLSFGIGLLTFILFPILFIVLLISLFGIPIGLILLAIFCILSFFAPIVVAITLGQKILEKTSKNRIGLGWSLLVGLLIYFVISIIPIIGNLISLIITLVGVGALLIQQKSMFQKLRSQKIV